MAKICCGGFNIGDGLELDGKTLKATGGSAGGMVVNFVFNVETSSVTADKTVEEVTAAMLSSVVIGVIDLGNGQPVPLGTALITASFTPAFCLADPNADTYFIDVDEDRWRVNS